MEFFDVLAVASKDEVRIESDQQAAAAAAEKVKVQVFGEEILRGESHEVALELAEKAAAKKRKDWRVWYELDPDVVYPAAIEWLSANGKRLIELSQAGDAAILNAALDGDKLAGFVARCRSYAGDNLIPLYAISENPWIVARAAKDVLDEDSQALRAKVLEAARLFATECLHQATGRQIGLHILKDPRGYWKL